MKRVFIVHGWSGSPGRDWMPWLKVKLEESGYQVFVPEMPDTDTPIIAKWVAHLSQVVGTPDDQTYFIGHSIGCQTILRYLETINVSVAGALFVAGWFHLENLENNEVRAIARPWIETPIDIKQINRALPKSILLISDNDPYNAFNENVRNFKELNTRIVVLHGAGHITADEGFSEAPIIREQFAALEYWK